MQVDSQGVPIYMTARGHTLARMLLYTLCGNESLLTLPRTSSPVGPKTLPAIGSNCSLATVSHCIVYATQLITAVNADVPAQPKLAPGKNTPVEGIGNELGKLNWSFQALQI